MEKLGIASDTCYVIGLDFGTDSVRALVVDCRDGTEISSAVTYYPRWKAKKYCNPALSQYRQHPLDYVESLEQSIRKALHGLPDTLVSHIKGIGVDATGSTPVAVHESGVPLALVSVFEEEPDAMFVLWKDHTAQKEADEINALAHGWDVDYTKYSGGLYSPEWFWSKILHIVRKNPQVRGQAYTWVEQSDWIPALLTGNQSPDTWKRNRCAAGHKAMWHAGFDGLPSETYLNTLQPGLGALRKRLYSDTFDASVPAGAISREWAQRLGLNEDVIIATGIIDAHAGAVGANIEAYTMVKVTGTSTCDMVVAPLEQHETTLVKGICGQVDGSILPGMLGFEAGQSAFGDLYKWFVDILTYPLSLLRERLDEDAFSDLEKELYVQLGAEAECLPLSDKDVVALDWINGRRTPDVDLNAKAALVGLSLGTAAADIYKALVEATVFGAKAIVDRFTEEQIPIEKIIAVGGISKKSPYVMQVMANVLQCPIYTVSSEQTCALGAAIFAAVASGVHPNVGTAQKHMSAKIEKRYLPVAITDAVYKVLYHRYRRLGQLGQL
ncbi:MAG: ribulokinase [Chitinophagaceae bacterium]